jgi:hypothetical protein
MFEPFFLREYFSMLLPFSDVQKPSLLGRSSQMRCLRCCVPAGAQRDGVACCRAARTSFPLSAYEAAGVEFVEYTSDRRPTVRMRKGLKAAAEADKED